MLARLAPYLILLGQVLIFYRQVLFDTRYAIPYDLPGYHLPLATYLARAIRDGALLLWDPYTYCGFPFYANPQAAVFYPPQILASAVGAVRGLHRMQNILEWQVVLHVFLAGALCYVFLVRLGVSRGSATLGATVFQLGGFFASQTQHLGAISCAAWSPLAWTAILALAKGFSWRWSASLAGAMALAYLAGFPAVTAAIYVSCGMLAAALIVTRQASWRLLIWVGLSGLWAAGLAAVQLLPALELTRLSTAPLRGSWGGFGGGIPLQALVSLIAPNYHSLFDWAHLTLPYNPTFLYLYSSIAGLLCALWALVALPERRVLAFLLVLVVAGFWMLGEYTPVGFFVYQALPGMIRAPLYAEHVMCVVLLALATLAALGADRLPWRARTGWILTAVAAAELTWAGSGRPMNTEPARHAPRVTEEEFEGSPLTAARIRELVEQNMPPYRIDTAEASFNWTSAAPILRIPTANGNDPLALRRYLAVRRLFTQGPWWMRFWDVSSPESPLLDLVNVRYVLSWKIPWSPVMETVYGHQVWENKNVLPRFFLVDRARHAANSEEAVSFLRAPEFKPAREAVVEDQVRVDAGASGTVRVLQYGAREVQLETEASGALLMVSSEVHYPGWRAWVDGREQPIVLTNAAFRGVVVPAGRHTIRMRFEPRILRVGAVVSALAVVLAVYLSVSERRARATTRLT